MADRWLSPGPPVSSTNKTDRHDITEILALYTIKPEKKPQSKSHDLNNYLRSKSHDLVEKLLLLSTLANCLNLPMIKVHPNVSSVDRNPVHTSV